MTDPHYTALYQSVDALAAIGGGVDDCSTVDGNIVVQFRAFTVTLRPDGTYSLEAV